MENKRKTRLRDSGTFRRYTIHIVASAGESGMSVLRERGEDQGGGEREGKVGGFVIVWDWGGGMGGRWCGHYCPLLVLSIARRGDGG